MELNRNLFGLFVQPQLLVLFFFFLLIAHILAHHVFVETYCIDTISSRPEMVAPIWLLAQTVGNCLNTLIAV